mmetsp:Transcript_40945/g.86036  ORF Transcript_40945/g.86036 Transcript_40945/m.86036 type:complete len:87 (-) Transcript_40945:158-418(-)
MFPGALRFSPNRTATSQTLHCTKCNTHAHGTRLSLLMDMPRNQMKPCSSPDFLDCSVKDTMITANCFPFSILILGPEHVTMPKAQG